MNESEFKRTWLAVDRPGISKADLAYEGGRLADRLAFLFLAGYQAAVRSCFETRARTWTVFAVSEDRNADHPLPGLTLDQAHLLNGTKTWVAAADVVDDIVVTARRDEQLFFFRVGREQPGLSLVSREQPGFLSEMSQGTATFTGVPAADLLQLDPIDLKHFGLCEPVYLYLAFCGFLAEVQGNSEVQALRHALADLTSADLSSAASRGRLAELDTHMTALMLDVDPSCFNGNVDADKSLVTLYSRGIQKRAGKR